MTSPPDKYLQDQFAHLRKSPPPEAWNRIQSGLEKNKSKRIWLRVAAAILFLVVTSISLLQINKTTTEVQVVASKPVPTEKNITQPSKIIPAPENQTASPVTSNTNTTIPTPVSPIKVKQTQMSSDTEFSKDMSANQTEVAASPALNPSATEQIIEVETHDEEVIPMTSPTQQKISYSAAEVNARFIKKNDPLTAPPAAKSETGFKKILDIAYDLKYDESALGELRQKKNEILSFPLKENLREK